MYQFYFSGLPCTLVVVFHPSFRWHHQIPISSHTNQLSQTKILPTENATPEILQEKFQYGEDQKLPY